MQRKSYGNGGNIGGGGRNNYFHFYEVGKARNLIGFEMTIVFTIRHLESAVDSYIFWEMSGTRTLIRWRIFTRANVYISFA